MPSRNGVHSNGKDRECVPSSQAELVTLLYRHGVRLETADIEELWNGVRAREVFLVLRAGFVGTTLVRRVQDIRAMVRFEQPTEEGILVYTLAATERASVHKTKWRTIPRFAHAYSLRTHLRAEEQPLHALHRILRDVLHIGMPKTITLSRTGLEASVPHPGFLHENVFRLYEATLDLSQFQTITDSAVPHRFAWNCTQA